MAKGAASYTLYGNRMSRQFSPLEHANPRLSSTYTSFGLAGHRGIDEGCSDA